MTSASISSRVGRSRCIPQTSATYPECVISCRFLCRPAWCVFASWFYRFADSRGMVTFRNVRHAQIGMFSLLFHPYVTLAWMAEVRWIFSLILHELQSIACPVQVHPFLLLLQSNLSLSSHVTVCPLGSQAPSPNLLSFFYISRSLFVCIWVGNCCAMLSDPYKGDSWKYRRRVILLLLLVSRHLAWPVSPVSCGWGLN